jgi:membrane protein
MPTPRLRPLLADAWGFVCFVYSRADEDRCEASAAGLTWVTLFSLVPMFTVFYTVLSLAPGFRALGTRLQELVFLHFVPATGQEIQRYLAEFTDHARSLTVPGTLILFVSAWLMLRNIEDSFNRIWRVRQGRKGVMRFVLYWAILSLGPLLAGGALLVSAYLFPLGAPQPLQHLPILQLALAGLLPSLFTFIAFTLLYVAVPNRRVPLLHGAIGGLVTTLVFDAGKSIFAWAVAKGSYGLVYGAFAALPLFLLWLYMSWLLLLVGAEFVYALSHWQSNRAVVLPDALAALAVLERAHRAHQAGILLGDHDILAPRALGGRYRLHPEHWESLRRRLLESGLLRSTPQGEYVLGKDAEQVPLWRIASLFGWPSAFSVEDPDADCAWLASAAQRLGRAEDALHETLGSDIASLFETTERT